MVHSHVGRTDRPDISPFQGRAVFSCKLEMFPGIVRVNELKKESEP